MDSRILFAFAALLLAGVAESGNIMFFGPFVSKSMVITYTPILKELAKKGHQVGLQHLWPALGFELAPSTLVLLPGHHFHMDLNLSKSLRGLAVVTDLANSRLILCLYIRLDVVKRLLFQA